MSQNAFSIDGTYYDVIIPEGGIERSFQILDDDTAGRVLSGAMQRSIIGTYYNYKIELDTSRMDKTSYDAMYAVLSAPEDYHVLVVPFGQTTLTFDAYITSGTDRIQRITTSGNNWTGLTLNFIAIEPFDESMLDEE